MTPNASRPIMRLSLLLGALLLVTLIACQTEGPNDQTPAPTIKAPSLLPQEAPITTLLRNPASFEGQTIWVTGQYRALPLLVCREATHRSPATWTLVFGDVETFAAGFDEALRPLAATGLSLTVEGRWQKWTGPVGCGRRASTEEIWYLAASRIVSPNPLVKSEEEEVIVQVLSPTPEVPGQPDDGSTPVGFPTFPPDDGEPTSEPDEEEEPTAVIPSPTFQTIPSPPAFPTDTPRPTATSETTGGGGGNTTPTPTPTSSATPTPDGTPQSQTETPTPTASATTTGGTPSATAQPSGQGLIGFDTVQKSTLAANSPHSWRFTPPATEPIIITVGGALNLNISLDLIAPDGTVVAKANDREAGKPETINYTTPNPTGEYKLVISGVDGTSGAYVVILFDSSSEPVVAMQDTINYGSGGSGSNPASVDHFWNFEGQAGDVISIEVSPSGNSGDVYLYFIGPDGSQLEAVDEVTGVGSESLTNYTLIESGFYSIGIGEANFEPFSYIFTLTK